MRYIVGYNRQNRKYVLLDYGLNRIAEFDFAKELFDYCDERGYEYAIL